MAGSGLSFDDADGTVPVAGRIRVSPSDVSFDVAEGETVYSAAVRQGIRWPSICHGDAECGICYMVVTAGEDNLSEKSKQEADRLALGLKAKEPKARLACRTRLNGDAVVERRGVRQ
jgi:2Fe-2S ferredoxin